MYQDLYQTITIVNVIIDYPFVDKFVKQGIIDHVTT
jgi:hypothetical protein